jgi:hypothetical protein
MSKASKHAKALSVLGAAKGGRARAEVLTPEERAESARKAAVARWGSDLPKATHGDPEHPLRIGDIELPCYVLDDGRRVVVQRGMLRGLDMKQGTAGRGAGDRLAKFIATKSINPYVPKGLADVIIDPIKFKPPGGGVAYGYEATVLADLCDAVLDARKKGKLNYQQEHIAERCEILMRGFARVGIIALVDEATGYQEYRDRTALQNILEAYVAKEFLPWTRRFPPEFYREMFRLRKWSNPDAVKKPILVGLFTQELVYKKLPPGVLEELKVKNPKDEKGRRKRKHHQFLTNDVGHPHLERHLAVVTALMRASRTWKGFRSLLDRAVPTPGGTQELLLPDMYDDQDDE